MTPASLQVMIDGVWRTPATQALTWTKTAPGGCLTADATISDKGALAQLEADSTSIISDPRTGKVLWDGYVRDPGARIRPNGGRDGKVGLAGSVQYFYDSRETYPYVARGPGAWVDEDYTRSNVSYKVTGGVSSEMVTDGGGNTREALVLQMKQGDAVYTEQARARCIAFDASPMTLGAILYGLTSRFTAGSVAPWIHRLIIGLPGGPVFHPIEVDPLPVLPAWEPVLLARAGVTAGLALGQREIRVNLMNNDLPAAGVNTDNYRVDLTGLAVLGDRVDIDGTRQTSMLTSPHYVLAHQVVRDVLGRFGKINPDRVNLATSTVQIEHLWFDTPTGLGDVLAGLSPYEPSWRWILPTSETGRYGFECGPWPSTARYVLDRERGEYAENPREDEIYNKVTVRFKGRYGRWQSASAMADPDIHPATKALYDREIERGVEVEIDTGGSYDAAYAAALALVPQYATPDVSATYGTGMDVLDLYAGTYVHPWEVEPGYLVEVSHTGELHRLTQSVCDGHAGTANLTLGRPTRTIEDLVSSRRRVGR